MRILVKGAGVLGCVWVFHILYFCFAVKTIPAKGCAEGRFAADEAKEMMARGEACPEALGGVERSDDLRC